MHHPFEAVDRKRRARWWRWITAATLLNTVVLSSIGSHLKTCAAPSQIVSYELAGTPEKAQAILDSWHNVLQYAYASLLVDFPYLILYSTAIGLACIWAGVILGERHWPGAALAIPLAWGQWLAAVLDATENASLLVMLGPAGPTQPWPAIAYWCAATKFLLVILGLLYAAYGLAVRIVARRKVVVD